MFSKSSNDVFDPVEANETKVKMEEVTVTKSDGVNRIGWLNKKPMKLTAVVTPWERVFCILTKGTIYFFDKQRSDERGHKKGMLRTTFGY
jgi:hypothetical protein